MASALQHVAVIGIFLVYPLIILRTAGVPVRDAAEILRVCMLALAAAVMLQAIPRGPVGSRFLAPAIFTGVYLAPSLIAVHRGGLALVWGMTIVAGCVEVGLSRVWFALRRYIPAETSGMVVLLVGLIIGVAALRLLVERDPGGMVTAADAGVAGVSLGVMIGLNVWNKGKLRLFCILAGMAAGCLLAGLRGAVAQADLERVLSVPLIAWPTFSHLALAFDASMIIPFAVSGLAAAMSATAVVTTYQRFTDPAWVRPEPLSIARGVFAEGIATILAGMLGTFGMTLSTPNAGLIAATGVASRSIAVVIAAALVLAAFFPPLVGMMTLMPPPVMAAAMLFTAAFIMIGGVQIIATRVLDARRTLVLGSGILAFFGVAIFPTAFGGVPSWLRPVTTSPLVLATLLALALNLLFRIGIRRTETLVLDPADSGLEPVEALVEGAGGAWGARRDVIDRVKAAMLHVVDAVAYQCQVKGPIRLALSYDEFDIRADISYEGIMLDFADRPPSLRELEDTDEALRRMAGHLASRLADQVRTALGGSGITLSLTFRG